MPSSLEPNLLNRMDAWWLAANCLSVGQICLQDNRFSTERGRDRISTAAPF